MEGETESGREGWREREGQSHQSAMPSFVHWFHWERIKNETVRECPWLCPFNYVFHSRWWEKTEGRYTGKALETYSK